MTVQSSFLIRCLLSASGDTASGKAYYIRHVQTGAEFRSGKLAEVIPWMEDRNARYLSEMANTLADPNSGRSEDLQ